MTDERQAIIARVYAEWAQELTDQVVPGDSAESQAAEGAEILAASVAQNDDLKARTDRALAEAGLPPGI